MKKPITKDYHIIQTNHPYFAELGLSTMTTGSLYDWWNTKNGDGVYVNRRHLNKKQGIDDTFDNPNVGYGGILGFYENDSTESSFDNTEFFWYGWKPTDGVKNDGRYLRQNLSDKYGNDAPGDLKGDGGSFEFKSQIGTVNLGNVNWDYYNSANPIIGGTLDELDGDLIFKDTTAQDKFELNSDPSMSSEIEPLYNLIQMNRWHVGFDKFFPRTLWDKDDDTTFGKENKSDIWGEHELLADIKAAKGGLPVVSWSGQVTFYVNVNDGLIEECPITEWVNFKMYLYDDKTLPTTNQGIALNSSTFVGVRRDVTGKAYEASADGAWTDVDEGEASVNKAAGELDMSYNSNTGKFEAGNSNLIAKMVSDLPPKANSPDVDRLIELDIKEALDNISEKDRFVLSSGEAMPIRMQNGNKLQWQPNYLNSEETRCEDENDKKKETLIVYNMTTDRTFRKNEDVMLTRIDGRWIVSQLGIDPSGEPEVDVRAGDVGKIGEIYQLMTNSASWYKASSDESNAVDYNVGPRDIEERFHAYYYNRFNEHTNALFGKYPFYGSHQYDYELNYDIDYGQDGGYNHIKPFSNKIPENRHYWIPARGYVQTTSFDCLDSKVCGIRGRAAGESDICTIATTNPKTNSCGININANPGNRIYGRNGAYTGGFFGLLVEGGYASNSDYFGESRDYVAQPWSYFTGLRASRESNLQSFTAGQIAADAKPFQVGDPEGFDVNAGTNRNNCRHANSKPANEPRQDLDGDIDHRWSRCHFHPEGSMFFQETVNGSTALVQLPADIALNASPSGVNGSPLYSIHKLADMYEAGVPARDTNIYKGANEYLRKVEAVQGETPKYSENDSAFDFKPIGGTLMFRPLKIEAYQQFGSKKANPPQDPDNTSSPQNLTTTTKEVRTGMESEIHRTQFDFSRPVTRCFETREFQDKFNYKNQLFDIQNGLKYGSDIDDIYKYSYNGLSKQCYWATEKNIIGSFLGQTGDGAFQWAPPSMRLGPNAFGVISTFTTVRATKSITITTDNKYGMGNDVSAEFKFGGGVSFDITHTWGAAGPLPDYQKIGYALLAARIFHEHPRNQTVYDPRVFAVHHYNPDIDYAYDMYLDRTSNTTNFNNNSAFSWNRIIAYDDTGSSVTLSNRNGLKKELSGQNAAGEPIVWNYFAPVPSSTVDFKRPARWLLHEDTSYAGAEVHANDGYYVTQYLESGSLMFSNATIDLTNPTPSFFDPPLADEQFWPIVTSRVGKLLPYRYFSYEQGVPSVADNWHESEINILLDGLDHQMFPKTQAPFNENPSFITDLTSNQIKSIIYNGNGFGTGFSVGDKVGIESKNVVLRVTEVADIAGVREGVPVKLKYEGIGVNVTNTISSGTILSSGFKGPIRLDIIESTNGKDLDLSFLAPQIQSYVVTDPKPRQVIDAQNQTEFIVSSSKTAPQFTQGTYNDQDTGAADAFVVEQNETEIVLDPNFLSENNAYDVFYRFHNDTSMTWLAGDYDAKFHGAGPAGGSASMKLTEQFISASISTS